MAEISQFRFPTDIRFGAGARSVLAEFAQKYKVHRPLLVTDSGLPGTKAFRLVVDQMDRIWPGTYVKFTGVHPNPTDQDVEDAWESYTQGDCDGIVGLGGGSALDAAKALRLKVAFPDEALTDIPLGELPPTLTPMCAIPTTAGTGSEVGRSTVITVQKLGRKVVIGAPPLMAEIAILDPELTVGLPPNLTAWTGMDAMTHAVEAFVCPVFHPMCDAIALEAIRLVRLYLSRAYNDGADIEARGMMLVAAAMGAVSFQKDLGAAHSLSHPLSSEFGVQHGLANAIALPAVVRFNGESDSAQYERIAKALGCAESADNPAASVADFLTEFNRSIGITQHLRDLNVPREKLSELAVKAIEDGCHLSNPRQCTEDDMLRLYEEIW
ncbi:MAG: iron-containing alcohol dehydrogenase [Sedimentisphaerales bacterium]|nr:iron-containing alcohol dehydrogenase [Sedimentisphaerales bacterium]